MAKLNLMAKIGLDGKGFKKGADFVNRQADRIKKGIGDKFKKINAMGLLESAAGYAREQVAQLIEYSKEIKRTANMFGISVEQFQKLEHAAKSGGIELKTLMDAHKDLGKNTAEVLKGVGTKVDAFKALGIHVSEIEGKNIDEVFMRVSEAIRELTNPLEQVKAIEDLGGTAMFESLPVLRADLTQCFDSLKNWAASLMRKRSRRSPI